MTKEELLKKIEESFEQAGKKDSWIYRTYKNLYRKKQLDHYKIFDNHWFPGKDELLQLIDDLHTMETSKEDFLAMAKMQNLEVDSKLSKKDIAKLVKSNNSWRSIACEYTRIKQSDERKETLEPLTKAIELFGYKTDQLPENISYKKWTLECTRDGIPEKLILTENEDSTFLMLQSYENPFIGLIDLVENGLMKKL